MKLTKIHSDSRGEINILEGLSKYPEVTIFKTKKDHARGGCIHNVSDEYNVVIEGIIEYIFDFGSHKEVKKLFPGDTIFIPKGTPHYFISLMDSIVLEWGATLEEKKEKHLKTRAVVDKINKEQDKCAQ